MKPHYSKNENLSDKEKCRKKEVKICVNCGSDNVILTKNGSFCTHCRNITKNCGVKLKNVKIKIRQHIGCPAGCGGIMKEQVIGQICPRCGMFVPF